jgi:hypothetical protein
MGTLSNPFFYFSPFELRHAKSYAIACISASKPSSKQKTAKPN